MPTPTRRGLLAALLFLAPASAGAMAATRLASPPPLAKPVAKPGRRGPRRVRAPRAKARAPRR